MAASAQPNLVPRNIILSSYSVLPGDVITVEWTMTNSGNGFCPASFTAIRLGTSASVPPSNDPLNLMFSTPDIPAKSAVQQTASVTVPFTALGTYYIWVVADVLNSGLNQISRSDDAARSAALALQNVRGQPNLRPLDIALGAGSVRPGDLLTVMWTLTNSGSVTCPSSFTGLHVGTSNSTPPADDGLLIPTPEIGAHSSIRLTNTVTIPAVAALGTYYLWVVADDVENSTLNQSSRNDDAARSAAFAVSLVIPRPNLIPLNVTLSSYSARPGDQIFAMWTLTNSGTANCPASITGLHLGPSATAPPASDILNLVLPTPPINAGESVRLTNVVTIPANTGFGTYYLWVIADDVDDSPLNQTSRDDDAARSAAFTIAPIIALPNILPQNILLSAYSVRPGDQLSVMWTTTNIGNGDCAPSLTGLHLGTSRFTPPAIDGLNIRLATPAVPTHSAVRQTNTVTIPTDTPTGNYYFWVVVDDVPESTLGQSSREDDAGRSTLLAVVNVLGQPNLVPENVVLGTAFARPGDQVTVRWTMKNTGTVTCPTSLTGLRLGTSATAPTNSTVQIRLPTPEIAAGTSLTQTNVVTIPTNSPPGPYYCWVIADDVTSSTLNQSSRTDDLARAAPLAIVTELPRPNLVPLSVTLSVGSAQPGGQVTVTWSMTNSGNANCPASSTGLHLGSSVTAPPANDSLNLKIAMPAINAGSTLQQTNIITIPVNIPAGTYYLWVVADDLPNSQLNQTSKADDAAHSGPLNIVTETPRPNLVPLNVTLSISSVQPGGQVTVMWTMTNSGTANCPASTTGLRLGITTNAPLTNDALNLKIPTPAISAGSSVHQTNIVTIPSNTPAATYYLWIVADDVLDSGLDQSSKSDDAAHSEPLLVMSDISDITLITPALSEIVNAPPTFSWLSPGVIGTTAYLATKTAPVLGTDSVAFLNNPNGTNTLRPTPAEWATVVSTLGFAPDYYWTVGSANTAQRQVYSKWRPFKVIPLIRGGTILPASGGDFQFEVVAPNHPQVVIQTSEILANDWSDTRTTPNTTGTVTFTDESAGARTKLFYRTKP